LKEFEKVKDVKVRSDMSVKDLIEAYRSVHGFTAGDVAYAVDILREGLMKADLKFLSFTGNLMSTGLRGVIIQLIDSGLFDVVITTCGTLDHDIARALGGTYLKGSFLADDRELKEKGFHRLGNVFIPFDSYGPPIEEFVKRLTEEAAKIRKEWGIRELLELAGKMLQQYGTSFLGTAFSKKIKVYVPGFVDGAFGTDLFINSQFSGLRINLFKDMKELSDMIFKSKVSAALIIGGGISKHHTIWWNQFKEGLDYSVYITTAVEWDGSLSGARTREAISWGKIKPTGRHVTLYGDATVLLPIIAAGMLEPK